ncbi:hypothetical protein SDB96_15855 [Legionella pneumophila serogroup 1]|uniref:hypothetical protein n=1 Tax=Legionella pneumophila TaxID=446 RepID=UPI0039C4B200|nr:hypothetical protein [Legionella pneumophila subsp. pneumophila]
MNYNGAFFGLFENVFKLLKKEYGEEKALSLFTQLMEMGLSKSYGKDFKYGDPFEFKKLVAERDKVVGLHVEFPEVTDNKIIYQFHDDPFPNLKGEVNHKDLDKCYLNFKINYILGSNWKYKTTKHLWDGDLYTEHEIYKII